MFINRANQYDVISDVSRVVFVRKCQEKLKDGWALYGEMKISQDGISFLYTQTFIK